MTTENTGMIVNGDHNAQNAPSPAALLEQQHAHDQSLRPTVEEVPDETEVQNPPLPSVKNGTPSSSGEGGPSSSTAGEPVSKGKGKAPVLDVRSEELFPALGGGPKPRAPAAVPTAWGARKPQTPSYAPTNGASNGAPQPPTNGSAGPPLPEAAPGLAGFGSSTGAPRIMTMPGKHVERIRLAPSQMLPRGQLKKPIRDVLRDISKRSKATVDMHNGPGDSLIFEGTGSVEAVRQALKDVAQQVGSKVCFFYSSYLFSATATNVTSNPSGFQFLHPQGHILLAVLDLSSRVFINELERRSRFHDRRK